MIELFYPLKPHSVNQAFGRNNVPYYAQSGLKGHTGLDLKAYHGQPIYASCGGVCYPQVDDHGGNGVLIRTSEYQFVYWHLIEDDAVVHTGQVVKVGDLIGYADNTGRSTGDHLHFGVIPLIGADPNNGYKGAIDPQPFFNGKYAQDINNPPPPELEFQFNKVLKMGSWNNDVKQLQTLLKGQNYPVGALDGIFGIKTHKAVQAFQKAHNLAPDGICGKLTNTILNSML